MLHPQTCFEACLQQLKQHTKEDQISSQNNISNSKDHYMYKVKLYSLPYNLPILHTTNCIDPMYFIRKFSYQLSFEVQLFIQIYPIQYYNNISYLTNIRTRSKSTTNIVFNNLPYTLNVYSVRSISLPLNILVQPQQFSVQQFPILLRFILKNVYIYNLYTLRTLEQRQLQQSKDIYLLYITLDYFTNTPFTQSYSKYGSKKVSTNEKLTKQEHQYICTT
eukprot:TRINITY_DN10514_c0_g1_i4.p2 TRINITY_DN10514_c0_g1~~TRINITY_DN10514_c0_g1_i4.p2  ORF type:complete len:220 (+),score=-27.22 TRINITY_DN10514_c0_g1_i4:773-1432(+)